MNQEKSDFKLARSLVLLGAGGHARVLVATARALGFSLLGVCDPRLKSEGRERWEELIVLGDDTAIEQHKPDEIGLMLGVGQLVRDTTRTRLYNRFYALGYSFPPLVHPTAWVAPGISLPDGAQIMAGAVVQPGCILGRNVIINTRASVDHDCRIADNVHIAPGAILCGGVEIGTGAFIGAGAVLIQGLNIGNGAIVGAGVTLVRDLPAWELVVGPPNRFPHSSETGSSNPGLAR